MSATDDIEMINILKKCCIVQELILTGGYYIRILDETPKDTKEKIKKYFIENSEEIKRQQKIDEIRGV